MSYKVFLKSDQDFYELKNRAVEYYRTHRVTEELEELLNHMFVEKPADIYGYMANYFSRLSHTPVISSVVGRQVLDSRGDPALQADVYCIIRNQEKLVCSAVITCVHDDAVKSEDTVATGNHQQVSVATALDWIRDHLSSMLNGLNPTHQTHLDKVLRDFLLARYLEDQDAHNREKKSEEEERKSESTAEATPPPQLTQSKEKKGGEKGKKVNAVEKSLPPPEPPLPVLPGAMAVTGVSLATAKSAACLTAVPLYTHILSLRERQVVSEVFMPLLMVTVLSCGKSSAGKLNLLEELILLPTRTYTTAQMVGMSSELQREMKRIASASKTGPAVLGVSEGGALQVSVERSEQALDLLMEACGNLGLPMGSDLRLAINCAAHTLMDYSRGKYEVCTGTLKSPDELLDVYVGLVSKYPAITALIDPFRKEDVEQWQKLSSLIGQFCFLVADAAVSPRQCWREAPPLPPGVTWVTFNIHNHVTLTDLLQTITQQTETGGETILSVSAEEIGDDSVVDVAVGAGVSFIKLGGLSGGGRMNKYNRLLRIEQELQEQGILGMREVTLPRKPKEAEPSPDEGGD